MHCVSVRSSIIRPKMLGDGEKSIECFLNSPLGCSFFWKRNGASFFSGNRKSKSFVIPPSFSSVIRRSIECQLCQMTGHCFPLIFKSAKLDYTPTWRKWSKYGRFLVKNKLMKLRRSLNYPLKDTTRILEENLLLTIKLPCYTDIFRKKNRNYWTL